jgi:alkylation response protein AidB-like acyl-CoA dehydrogenase
VGKILKQKELAISMEQTKSGTVAAPSIEELVNRAKSLAPAIAARAQAAETACCLPKETIRELREAELFRALQPRRFGGFAMDFECLVLIASELGKVCGSTAWVYSVGAFHSWNLGLFSDEAQEEVWGTDPNALAASSYVPAGTATTATGGVQLTGRWPFASGCDHFEWIVLGAKENAEENVHFYLVPKSNFEIERDWRVAGLAATGSNTVILKDVFVPDHRRISFDQAKEGVAPGAMLHEDIYRLPFFAVSSYCLVGPALGMAAGALQSYIDGIRGREVRSLTGAASKLAEYDAVQTRVAQASGLIDAATELIRRDCRDVVATLRDGQPITTEQRTRNKRDQAMAVRFAKQAVQMIIDGTGAKGLYNDQPIQRAWRDLQAAGAHITLSWDILMPAHGRVLLGLEPDILI